MNIAIPTPGAMVRVRSSTWKVMEYEPRSGGSIVSCRGVAGIVKGKSARFVLELERDYAILDPAEISVIADSSPGLMDTKLFLEAAFRSTPTTAAQPLTFGKAAIDDLAFQQVR